jgi:hypothetical protein
VSLLPRVIEKARELIAREFDACGPDACMAEIIEHLERHNPELLDMAAKWGADLENPANRHVLSSSQSGAPGHQRSDPAAARERRDALAVGEGNR